MEDDDDDADVALVLDASVDNTVFDDDNDGRVASTGPFGGRSFVMDGRDGGETSSVGSMQYLHLPKHDPIWLWRTLQPSIRSDPVGA